MKLQLFKTLWGHGGSYRSAVAQARAQGYDGIEAAVPTTTHAVAALVEALGGLPYIAEICTGGGYVPDPRADLDSHLAELDQALRRCRPLKPMLVTCIAGSDGWAPATALRFFREALDLAERHRQTLCFETHRSRPLFHPWVTLQLLDALPELRLTCDFSHWCVVCERLFEHEEELLAAVAQRAHHIHARVGYDQGPQVPHPAAPEYAHCLAAHQRWWELIWESQRRRGYTVSTMTPEFGPDGYLHRLPFTGAPVGDLEEINRWMLQTERAHFARRAPHHTGATSGAIASS